MTRPHGHLNFSFTLAGAHAGSEERVAPGAGQLLFIAPYSGSHRPERTGPKPMPRPLGVDAVAEGFAIVPAAVQLEPVVPGGEPMTLALSDVNSLHPDQLLEVVPSLASLWRPLRNLYHDSGAADLLKAMLSEANAEDGLSAPESLAPGSPAVSVAPEAATALASEPTPQTPREGEGDLLGRLLGQRPAHAAEATPPEAVPLSPAQALVQRLVAKAAAGVPTERRGAAVDAGDIRTRAESELSSRLRALLRQEDLRAVQGSWFATERVVRACPDDSRAQFSAVDASWRELASDPLWLESLLDEGVATLLVDHVFGATAEELQALVAITRACVGHDVFFVTGADPSLVGVSKLADLSARAGAPNLDTWQSDWSEEARQAWAELGSMREAGAQFALVLPQWLVRQPYGRRGEPIEKFDFEELSVGAEPGAFVWANGAYLVAQAIMEQWCGGQSMLDGSYEVKGLPVVTVPELDGVRLQPALEVTLPSSTVEQLLNQGFSVIEAVKNTDRARVHL